MKKETRGRKPKKASEKKSVKVSVRCTEPQRKKISEKYDTFQEFFDKSIKDLK